MERLWTLLSFVERVPHGEEGGSFASYGLPGAGAADWRIQHAEWLWLNDKNAVIGLTKMNPPRDSAVNKSLSKKAKPPSSAVPVFKPWGPAQPGSQ